MNGDSINDIVTYLESSIAPNCLRILLGTKAATGVIEFSSTIENTFKLTDPSPHPLTRSQVSSVSANIIKDGIYLLELFTIQGKKISELNKQYLEPGNQNISFDISRFSVPSGSYILRLSNELGTVIGQRIIIIN